MNRSQLVDHIANSADIPKAKADAALSALIEGVTDTRGLRFNGTKVYV